MESRRSEKPEEILDKTQLRINLFKVNGLVVWEEGTMDEQESL
jgi:hypothetical protein